MNRQARPIGMRPISSSTKLREEKDTIRIVYVNYLNIFLPAKLTSDYNRAVI